MAYDWLGDSPLLKLKEVEYRNKFAENLSTRDAEDITKSFTYLGFEQAKEILNIIQTYMKTPFAGVGIELGAGTGLFSAAIASNNEVKRMYALELVPGMATSIIPKIANEYLGSEKSKLIPVIGSFDDIHLPNESLDFAFEYDAFHHSSDLDTTFREIYRKLKKGGLLILLDRCHPNALTDTEVEAMLKITYSEEFLVQNGYPIDLTLSRADNGEHEYRLDEWLPAIDSAGFKKVKYGKFYPRIKLKHAYWYLVRKLQGRRLKDSTIDKNILSILLCQITGISIGDYNTVKPLSKSIHKETTLFILQK